MEDEKINPLFVILVVFILLFVFIGLLLVIRRVLGIDDIIRLLQEIKFRIK